MGLKIKEATKELDSEDLSLVWIGDDAVDQKKSDAVTWCRYGGHDGLVIKKGKEPDKIIYRRLTNRELGELATVQGAAAMVEAARFGVLDVPGVTCARLPTGNKVRGMMENPINILTSKALSEDLPYDVLSCLVKESKGVKVDWKAAKLDTEEVSLAHVIGARILAATFRFRRGPA